jgi:hypothetical protein
MTGVAGKDDRFRFHLPYPLAINYKRIGACPRNDAQRLMYVLKTAEMTARFLGIVALAELYRMAPPARLGGGPELVRRLSAPSFGTWLWILREVLAVVDLDRAQSVVRKLAAFYGRDGKPTAAARKLEALCATRNRFAHDGVPADEWLEPRQIPHVGEQSLAELEAVLGELMFLIEFPLVVMSPVEVKKRRGSAATFVRTRINMTGCADPFDKDEDASDELCETAEALLLDQRARTYLNLSPLVLYSNEGVEDRERDGQRTQVRTELYDIFLFNGGGPGRRRYLACGKGGVLNGNDLADADHIDAQLLGLERVVRGVEVA